MKLCVMMGLQKMTTLNKTILVKYQEYEQDGRLDVKIRVLLLVNNFVLHNI
jgi:hypothetical protein